jgi:hypothetical protein
MYTVSRHNDDYNYLPAFNLELQVVENIEIKPDEIYSAEQPDYLDNEEYNTAIYYKGTQYRVNSIDFEFFGTVEDAKDFIGTRIADEK